MKRRNIAVAIAALAVAAAVAPPVSAASEPCEDLLQKLRTAKADAKLSEADQTKVDELEAKGIERCNADDDRRADEFFNEALKVLGK